MTFCRPRKSSIVPDTLTEELLGMFTGEQGYLVDEVDHVLIEEDLVAFAGAFLDFAISH